MSANANRARRESFCYINRVGFRDRLVQFQIIAMFRSNRPRSDFLLRDGVKTIEKVHCGITVRIACAFPNRHVQVFRERLGNQSQHLASCGSRLLSVSLGGTCAEQG